MARDNTRKMLDEVEMEWRAAPARIAARVGEGSTCSSRASPRYKPLLMAAILRRQAQYEATECSRT